MKRKTSELSDHALDWTVAKCEGVEGNLNFWGRVEYTPKGSLLGIIHKNPVELRYSTDWSQGGPIIEREGIELGVLADAVAVELHPTFKPGDRWEANIWPDSQDPIYYCGLTPLIAAMRCYVASKLGGEVDVPEELL